MIKLYFSGMSNILSTLLIVVFAVFFGLVYSRRNMINHWGLLVLFLFFLGLFMSFLSGMKDKVGTAQTLIPNNHWAMTVLCLLGALCFIAGIVMLIIRRQNLWQLGFYMLSLIIIVKIIITEAYRIIAYLKIS